MFVPVLKRSHPAVDEQDAREAQGTVQVAGVLMVETNARTHPG